MIVRQGKLPVIVVRGTYIFPVFPTRIDTTVGIGRTLSLNSVERSIEGGKNRVLVLNQKSPDQEEPGENDIYRIGTVCSLAILEEFRDGSMDVNLVGVKRAKVSSLHKNGSSEEGNEYWEATYNVLEEKELDEKTENKLKFELLDLKISRLLRTYGSIPAEIMIHIINVERRIGRIVDLLAQSLPRLSSKLKQSILEETDPVKRYKSLVDSLDLAENIEKVEKDISKKVQKEILTRQREYYLEEKLKAIKEELDQAKGIRKWSDRILKEIAGKPYPEHVKKRIEREVKRYDQTHPSSPEGNVIRNYVETVMSIPWFGESKENHDLLKASKILDKYHYGLREPKESVIGYLASRILRKKLKIKAKRSFAQIVCLVGAPGIGKTSFAQAIAKATGRKYVRVSLGGIHDESEIRGHRKTYIGSMPGRIIQAMRRAGVTNPLFLLDEIDKLSFDYRGDPASALLEVLDPEQNSHFSDNYIEEDYDLSKVMFVTTANYDMNIPDPLRDRLEIIHLPSYSEDEKLGIARYHLVEAIKEENGLKKEWLTFTTSGIMEIIRHYTREAGVRELGRMVSRISRKFAAKILKRKKNKVVASEQINKKRVSLYLERRKFELTESEKEPQIGVVTGLAFVSYGGGDILPIEAEHFPGHKDGKLHLTGKLGNVMKESAAIALDYIKAGASRGDFKINYKLFDNDIHIHAPEGAVAKEGPSAGTALTTAIISSLKRVPIPKTVAMTGEISLHGRVIAVGGIREKVTAAFNTGIIKKIFIPVGNKKDMSDVPKKIRSKLKFSFVSHYFQIYKELFTAKLPTEKKESS